LSLRAIPLKAGERGNPAICGMAIYFHSVIAIPQFAGQVPHFCGRAIYFYDGIVSSSCNLRDCLFSTPQNAG